jgi:hypothetical protein
MRMGQGYVLRIQQSVNRHIRLIRPYADEHYILRKETIRTFSIFRVISI